MGFQYTERRTEDPPTRRRRVGDDVWDERVVMSQRHHRPTIDDQIGRRGRRDRRAAVRRSTRAVRMAYGFGAWRNPAKVR